jgi:hypothetical protein
MIAIISLFQYLYFTAFTNLNIKYEYVNFFI